MSTVTASLAMGDITFREAIRSAMCEAMEDDPRVFLMGEDVGRYGGCYAVSKGMLDQFGPQRIIDTPLSESGFVGAGIGAAMGGMRPIVEVMTVNFSLLALDQIVNNAATLLHMSGGQLNVPLVIRMACGAGKQLAAQHSHSFEGWYAHVPGLKVLYPGTVADARYMLRQALADPDPVVIFEHVMLYNQSGTLQSDAESMDMHQAVVRRKGSDLTLISWGACLQKALQAAEHLELAGISAQVLDLRCLRPLDETTLLACIQQTHRAVIVDESWKTGGMSAEISALLAEKAFSMLSAPVLRVCSQEVPIPYPAHLEQAALPQVEQIVAAAQQLMGQVQSRSKPPGPTAQIAQQQQTEQHSLDQLTMPSLGADMAEGVISEWLVKPGDSFKRGDVLALIETQKGVIELDVFSDGVIDRLLVETGQQVPVGEPIALIQSGAATATQATQTALEQKPEPSKPRFEQNAMRQAISDTVTRSKREIPHYYLGHTLDITQLEEYLAQHNRERPPEQRILLLAPLLCAIARGLQKHPQLNGCFTGDGFAPSDSVALAHAVNLRGGGLVMPVIHQAQSLTCEAMMQALNETVDRAKRGQLRQSDLQGATCTVTSIGERGAELIFGVIYPPQVAIIGLGKPRHEQDASLMTVTLAADHRVSDGHLGGRFLYQLNQAVQQPEALWSEPS